MIQMAKNVMAIFYGKSQKSPSNRERNFGCDTIMLHQFAQHDDKM